MVLPLIERKGVWNGGTFGKKKITSVFNILKYPMGLNQCPIGKATYLSEIWGKDRLGE